MCVCVFFVSFTIVQYNINHIIAAGGVKLKNKELKEQTSKQTQSIVFTNTALLDKKETLIHELLGIAYNVPIAAAATSRSSGLHSAGLITSWN